MHYKPKPLGAYRDENMRIRESIELENLARSAGVSVGQLSTRIINVLEKARGETPIPVDGRVFPISELVDDWELSQLAAFLRICGIPRKGKEAHAFRLLVLDYSDETKQNEIEN